MVSSSVSGPVPDLVAVERAISEMRSGRPVVLVGGVGEPAGFAIAAAVEELEAGDAAWLEGIAAGRARLGLSAARLRRLGLDRKEAGVIALPSLDLKRLELLALRTDAKYDAPVCSASPFDEAALELARIALVLPAVVVVPLEPGEMPARDLLRVGVADLAAYRGAQAAQIAIVSRAPVPLEGAPQTEFVVFRGGEGMRDQVAIIVGSPDLTQPVDVRLHSACLTGDLFGSLKCDCGDQLRDTVRHMAQNAGGILLYLDQEGRGNGIANKMRAYRLQAIGYDTYDADEVLGFGHDQRHFDFAARMLTQLGVTCVRIMTNNPLKIAALQAAGLEVSAEKRVIGRPTNENMRYLASKRDRAGHLIDIEALTARVAASD